MKTALPIILLSLLLVCCVSNKKNTKNPKRNTGSKTAFIQKNTWQLISYNGASPEEKGFKIKAPKLIINQETSQIEGYGGCNSFSGQVIISGDNIQCRNIASTKRFCLNIPEGELFEMLNKPLVFYFTNTQLHLEDNDGNVLIFKLGED